MNPAPQLARLRSRVVFAELVSMTEREAMRARAPSCACPLCVRPYWLLALYRAARTNN
jgi:hypothetical protein